ncbi:prolyl oligopeptidase family serine peptidase [Streptomyces sp. LX-29]|uniref:alpha/beta hydrolase family protein n=1 Tax=Streptomyces sp. LX-29 TaxID=2900152 RepID=UPI00240E53DF|nr:alpha/beta fold hydrolase [Streptomyces sp. LX-29]WFB11431.1 prolyl oligopeptidase family serine peptidase [Streptomyces sp. LX-29]
MTLTGDAGGRCEIFAWDGRTGRARQVTDRPYGTLHCAIGADAAIWWFDEDRDGVGGWRRQPFRGGPDRPALLGVPPGTPRGLASAADGTVAVGLGDAEGLSVYLGVPGRSARRVLRVAGPAVLAGLSANGELIAVSTTAAGPRAVTVYRTDGTPLARLSGRRGRIWALGFAPAGARRSGDPASGGRPAPASSPHRAPSRPTRRPTSELLLVREHGDGYTLATWSPGAGPETHAWCAFDTEITARWYPDGGRVLVRQDRWGRSRLFAVDLLRRTRVPIPVPAGTVLDAAPRGDDEVHYLWTDSATPPRLCSTGRTRLPTVGTPAGRVPGRHTELWTEGADGPVHTLLGLPDTDGSRPPLVFLVHGGPADHDRDAYDPMAHSLVASGYAVARVNYRGSTGYGPRWRGAYREGVGLTQVADLAAVRAEVLRRGLVRPDAVGLWGTSWGGYLVLLALGTRPDLWQAGVAVKPVADCALAHRLGTPALRALDEALFGGTPEEVPERYARSSPLRYAARVRAPLLVVAGTRDAKCPPGQIRSYLSALTAAGVPHEAMWLDTGHDGYLGGEHIAVLRRAMTFLGRGLRGAHGARSTRPPAAEGAGATGAATPPASSVTVPPTSGGRTDGPPDERTTDAGTAGRPVERG